MLLTLVEGKVIDINIQYNLSINKNKIKKYESRREVNAII